jgi:pimeloyl-ACP methyl ester carboxylesterase
MIKTGILSTADNEKIAYRLYKNGFDRVVVIAHGFFNSKDSVLLTELAEHLAKEQDVFIFDFRGHGESSGFFTWTSREKNDLEAVLKYIKGEYNKIDVIGFSMGGSVSINVLSKIQIPINSLICISTPSDCSKVDYKWWKLDLENDIWYSLFTKNGTKGKGVRPGSFWLAKEKPIENINRLKMPVLYIHGDKDWVVNYKHSERLHDKTISPKRIVIIKNGPHAEYLMRKYRNVILDEIDGWLKINRDMVNVKNR